MPNTVEIPLTAIYPQRPPLLQQPPLYFVPARDSPYIESYLNLSTTTGTQQWFPKYIETLFRLSREITFTIEGEKLAYFFFVSQHSEQHWSFWGKVKVCKKQSHLSYIKFLWIIHILLINPQPKKQGIRSYPVYSKY